MSILMGVLGTNVQPLTVSVSLPSVFGGRVGAGPVSTNQTTAIAQGGVAPYSYAWSYDSGDATFTATAGTSATTAFTATVNINNDKITQWKIIVTDAIGTVSAPAYVQAEVIEFSYN